MEEELLVINSRQFENLFIAPQTTEDPRTWTGGNPKYQIEVRLLSENRNLTYCKHHDCPVTRCNRIIACTCPLFCNSNSVCLHIQFVHASQSWICDLYRDRLKDAHLEILMNGGARKNFTDKFPYKKYFSDEENFCLSQKMIDRNHYWKGYESLLARHHYGMKLLLLKYEREINDREYSFTYNKNGVFVTYRTKISRIPHKCDCSPFELCSACRMCRHRVFCNCEDYVFGYFCEHCHATVMAQFNERRRPYQFINIGFYYRNKSRRYFYLGLYNRVRHNVGIRLPTIYYPEASVVLVEDIDDPAGEIIYAVKIKKRRMRCLCNTFMKCYVCKICVHDFNCRCADFKDGFLCVHVHAANLTCGGIKNHHFAEDERTLSRTVSSGIDDIKKAEREHPLSSWKNDVLLENEFLAYKHLFFDYYTKNKKEGKKIVLIGNQVMMVPWSAQIFNYHVRLLEESDDCAVPEDNIEILTRERKRDLIFQEFYPIYFPHDYLDSYVEPVERSRLKKQLPKIEFGPIDEYGLELYEDSSNISSFGSPLECFGLRKKLSKLKDYREEGRALLDTSELSDMENKPGPSGLQLRTFQYKQQEENSLDTSAIESESDCSEMENRPGTSGYRFSQE